MIIIKAGIRSIISVGWTLGRLDAWTLGRLDAWTNQKAQAFRRLGDLAAELRDVIALTV
jgi:hypothetical protein